jgi:hypothetical protein
MNEEWNTRIVAASDRARAAMAAGATLDDVLNTFRTDDKLGTIESMMALREIAPIPLWCLTGLLGDYRAGRRYRYAHLTLADLEMLGNAPPDGVGFVIHSCRADAIIERKPYVLLVRDHPYPRKWRKWISAIPLETPPPHNNSSVYGVFESVCSEARRVAAVWPTELRLLRDEPDQLLLHFLRTPLAN